jgi:hypothetical protein
VPDQRRSPRNHGRREASRACRSRSRGPEPGGHPTAPCFEPAYSWAAAAVVARLIKGLSSRMAPVSAEQTDFCGLPFGHLVRPKSTLGQTRPASEPCHQLREAVMNVLDISSRSKVSATTAGLRARTMPDHRELGEVAALYLAAAYLEAMPPVTTSSQRADLVHCTITELTTSLTGFPLYSSSRIAIRRDCVG